jgi:2OG-Fe(II) oxygenase superfamily
MSAIDFRKLMRDERMRRHRLRRLGPEDGGGALVEEGRRRVNSDNDNDNDNDDTSRNQKTKTTTKSPSCPVATTTTATTNNHIDIGAEGNADAARPISSNHLDNDEYDEADHPGRRRGSLDRESSSSLSCPLQSGRFVVSSSSSSSSSPSSSSPAALPPWTFVSSDDEQQQQQQQQQQQHPPPVESSLHEEELRLRLVTVCGDPPLLRYQDRFLSRSYAVALARWLTALPDAREYDPRQRHHVSNGAWTYLPHAERKVAVFDWATASAANGSNDEDNRDEDGDGSASHAAFRALLEALRPFFPDDMPPNHLLINSYGPHHKGILPHTDGPAYYPLTCTVSLGQVATFRLQKPPRRDGGTSSNNEHDKDGRADRNHIRIRLSGAGSLVVFSDDLYTHHLHSIDPLDDSDSDIGCSGEEGDGDGAGVVEQQPSSLDLDEVLSGPITKMSQQRHLRISITVRHKY